jgi:hypothetical protein
MTCNESSVSLPLFKVSTLKRLIYLIETPRITQNLKDIVDEQQTLKILRFPACHDPGTQHFHKVGVAETDGQRWEWTAHRDPILHTWI